jgi:ribosomal-protein-alanine N-acetyltransferase
VDARAGTEIPKDVIHVRPVLQITTARLVLRPFTPSDLAPFAALNAHPLVVASLGAPPARDESDAVVDAFNAELDREGWGVWAVGITGGPPFIGMVGLHRVDPALPCAPAVEIAWRLHPAHWGHGFATEAATASLHHGFTVGGLAEIVAFTAVTNTRSRSVMERTGMVRDPTADFDHPRVPAGSPLRRHVLYRGRPPSHPSRRVEP